MAESNPLPEERDYNWLDKVLDADSYEEKYDIVCQIRDDITDRLIDDIATVLDLTIPDGELDERYRQLKYCIHTKLKYESGRFR